MNTETEHPTITDTTLIQLRTDGRRWLDAYITRLQTDLARKLDRVLVYGSRASGEARADSDLDVLVLVDDATDDGEVARRARAAIWKTDESQRFRYAGHSVAVHSTRRWSAQLAAEMPFPRNVEAEGVQLHPTLRPAPAPPGVRPRVTRKGMETATRLWMTTATQALRLIEIERNASGDRDDWSGLTVRCAHDAAFFSLMAWCLVEGESVVRRRRLVETTTRTLIGPGLLDPSWIPRLNDLCAAWHEQADGVQLEAPATTDDDRRRWTETAIGIHALAKAALTAAGLPIDRRPPPRE